MASVTLSGAWRAKYSLSASLDRRLRDLLVVRARRSTPSKMSSGMDTAVFHTLSITHILVSNPPLWEATRFESLHRKNPRPNTISSPVQPVKSVMQGSRQAERAEHRTPLRAARQRRRADELCPPIRSRQAILVTPPAAPAPVEAREAIPHTAREQHRVP